MALWQQGRLGGGRFVCPGRSRADKTRRPDGSVAKVERSLYWRQPVRPGSAAHAKPRRLARQKSREFSLRRCLYGFLCTALKANLTTSHAYFRFRSRTATQELSTPTEEERAFAIDTIRGREDLVFYSRSY